MNVATVVDGHPDDRVALVSRGRPTTYGELRAQVAALRGSLVGLGVQPGDRVVLLFSNKRYFVDAFLAITGVGAVAVPLNPTAPAAALAHEVEASGATVVFVGSTALAAWRSIDRAAVPAVANVVVTETAEPGEILFDDLLGAATAPLVDREPGDLAVLMFTSGTVGHPRAAMLTHGNLVVNIEQSKTVTDRIGPDDVVYGVLPMYHIFGLTVMLLLTLSAGASVILVQRFDPSTALDTIMERGVTIVPGAPPMWVAWSQFPQAQPGAFANVRLALTGSAKMPEEATRALDERYGLVLREGYGLTEASPVVTTSVGIEPRLGSCGKLVAQMELRLVDVDGDDVEPGDAGELWLRGPNVFAGYWNDPEATARVLTPDGWLRTGDVAVQDDDGYLFIVDRAKDLVIVSGFNVYPAEVEEVVAALPGVSEVAVVGVPHPHTGEAVKAYVVLEAGIDLDEEQVIRWCQDHLARYKCPTKVLFVEEIPRGMAGKILRRVLR
jgi:long-chain acyl-CoA synthetase